MVSFIFMFIGALTTHRSNRILYMTEPNKNLTADLVPINLKDRRFGKSGNDERGLISETNTILSLVHIHKTSEIVSKLSSTTISDSEKCRFIRMHVEQGIGGVDIFNGGLMDDWLWKSDD
jgi:hypothetical protein